MCLRMSEVETEDTVRLLVLDILGCVLVGEAVMGGGVAATGEEVRGS